MSPTLLVESDSAVAEQLRVALRSAGHSVLLAEDGLEALRLFYENEIEVALVGMPVKQIDGIELIRLLRSLSRLPILVLIPSPTSVLTVRALEAGADDVMAKMVPDDELLARLRASARRASHRPEATEEQAIVETGDIVIDRVNRTVTRRGGAVMLTQTEYRLLDALAARIGRVAPHRFLLSTVWGGAFVDDTHYLRMYIGYLRSKLEDDPSHPEYLRNEWGTGYRLALLPQRQSGDAPDEYPEDSNPGVAFSAEGPPAEAP